MSVFFKQFEMTEENPNRPKKSQRVEKLIEKYSFKLYNSHQKYIDDQDSEHAKENNLLLRNDFDKLIEDIRTIYISRNYKGLMSYLLNRAFSITPGVQSKKNYMDSKTNNNRAILVRVLYEINPKVFLECFSNNIKPIGKN